MNARPISPYLNDLTIFDFGIRFRDNLHVSSVGVVDEDPKKRGMLWLNISAATGRSWSLRFPDGTLYICKERPLP